MAIVREGFKENVRASCQDTTSDKKKTREPNGSALTLSLKHPVLLPYMERVYL